jgi:hypothetical protein
MALHRQTRHGAGAWIVRATLVAWLMLPQKVWMIIAVGGVATLDGD